MNDIEKPIETVELSKEEVEIPVAETAPIDTLVTQAETMEPAQKEIVDSTPELNLEEELNRREARAARFGATFDREKVRAELLRMTAKSTPRASRKVEMSQEEVGI
jgi:hypothetical protein